MTALFLALSGIVNSAVNEAQAQTAIFSGIYSNVPTGTLNYAYGVAVDSNGNVYIANSGLGQVLKETLSPNGSYTESKIGSGLYFPGAIAVDASGNLYIADTDNNRAVKETLSGGTYVQSTLGSGLSVPYGIAVDGNGNVYIADTGNSRIVEESPSGGSYSQNTILTGTTASAVAVDGSGNLYLCYSSSQQVFKETLSGGIYTQSTIATGIGSPAGLAVDSKGVLYVADDDTSSAGRILEEIPTSSGYQQVVLYSGSIGQFGIAVDWRDTLYSTNIYTNQVLKSVLAGADFGPVKIGTSSTSVPLTFIFSGTGSMGAPVVLTQGITGLDFSDAGTGTCTTNGASHVYGPGDSCTVDVIFTPRSSGSRYGAVELEDSSNATIATAYVEGSGTGPQVNFLPGSQSTIGSTSINSPLGIAVDANGSLYVADVGHGQVVKETPSGGGYKESVVVSGVAPSNIAVDGGGNVYVHIPTGILKEALSGNGYVQSTAVINNYIGGMCVDAYGDIFLTEDNYSVVLKETPSPAGYIENTIPTSGLNDPFGVGVDGEGDLYIADPNNLRLVKETLVDGVYTQSNIPATGLTNDSQSIAVDANSNVYISDFGSKQVLKEIPSGGSYIQTRIPASGLNGPAGVAIDASGNLYIADSYNNEIVKEDFADAPVLNFANTTIGATSADSPQTLTMENIGNTDLTFPPLSNQNNPQISQNFSLDSSASGACPLVAAASSTAGTLAAASGCELSISFVPTVAGVITGSLVLTDTALNAGAPSYAVQSIALNGTGTKATPSETLISSASLAFLSNAVTFTAKVSAALGTPTGTVSFYDGTTLLGAKPLDSGSATYTTSALTVGVHPITAAYSGDSNFQNVTSSALSETIEDFTLSVVGSSTAAVSGGGQAGFTLSVAPPNGSTLAGPVTFTATGLPLGTTATFSPATVPGGSAATQVTLTVSAPTAAAMERFSYPFGGELPLALGLIWLPILRKKRRGSTIFLGRFLCWAAVAVTGAAVALGIGGCGGGGGSTKQPQNYNLTVTASSGSLSHSTSLTLSVN